VHLHIKLYKDKWECQNGDLSPTVYKYVSVCCLPAVKVIVYKTTEDMLSDIRTMKILALIEIYKLY